MAQIEKTKRKIVSLLLFVGLAAGGLGLLIYANVLGLPAIFKAKTSNKLMSMMQIDFESLKKENQLHEGFANIKDVQVFSASDKLKQAYFQAPLLLNQKKEGKFNLEIFLDEIEDGGVIVQYDLIDLATGNTVFEVGRTFQLTSFE